MLDLEDDFLQVEYDLLSERERANLHQGQVQDLHRHLLDLAGDPSVAVLLRSLGFVSLSSKD